MPSAEILKIDQKKVPLQYIHDALTLFLWIEGSYSLVCNVSSFSHISGQSPCPWAKPSRNARHTVTSLYVIHTDNELLLLHLVRPNRDINVASKTFINTHSVLLFSL